MRPLTLLTALFGLSCASLPSYDKPGSAQEHARVRLACELVVARIVPPRHYAQGIAIDVRRHNAKVSAMDLCLRAQGWRARGE